MLKKTRTIGQALIEFAFAATIIFFLLAAAVDLGMIYFSIQGLHNAAQEGAMYGGSMQFDDVSDLDLDDTIENDVYDNTNHTFYPAFVEEIRKRASYEGGKRGGIGYTSLRDLNSDGTTDNDTVLQQYIDVSLVASQTSDTPCGGDPDKGFTCYVKVKISTDYRIQFPLAPALPDDVIRLSSSFVVPLNGDGFFQYGSSNSTPVIATLTPSTTPLISATTTLTPTITPTPVQVCKDFISTGTLDAPWYPVDIGGGIGIGASSATGTDTYSMTMCAAGDAIAGFSDQFFYAYTERNGDSARNQEFVTRIDNWMAPGYGNKRFSRAGIMIRKSSVPGAPFAMVSHRPAYIEGATSSGDVVMFEYRSRQVESQAEGENVSVVQLETASPPVWLRLVRSNDKLVSASYATTTTYPDATDWFDITDVPGVGKWKEVDFDRDYAMFGAAVASGSEPISSDPNLEDAFAIASFSNVVINPIGNSDVEFIRPDDDQDGGVLATTDDSDFETDVTLADGVTVVSSTYELREMYDVSTTPQLRRVIGTWGYNGDMRCVFGNESGDDEGDDDDCKMMPDETYAQLQRRGITDYYKIVATLILDDGRIIQAERDFTIKGMEIDFVLPSTNNLIITDVISTNFEITAHDEKFGTDNGSGIVRARYSIKFTPAGETAKTEVFYKDITTADTTYADTTDVLCPFGGKPGTNHGCDTLPKGSGATLDLGTVANEPLDYNSLLPGTYIIDARVLTEGGDPDVDEHWSIFVSRSFMIPEPIIEFISPDPDGFEVQNLADTTFEVKAWLPHVGEGNGNGIGFVEFEIYHNTMQDVIDNITLKPLFPDYDNDLADVNDVPIQLTKFCLFGMDASECDVMPPGNDGTKTHTLLDFYRLESGTYTIRVRASYEHNTGTSNWTYRSFTIPELPIELQFVNDAGDARPTGSDTDPTKTALGYITSRDYQTDFRAIAFVDDESVTDEEDGLGIEQVVFTFYDIDGKEIGSYALNGDTTAPFCMFGEETVDTVVHCTPMDNDTYDNKLPASADGTYRITVRAQMEPKTGEPQGRWSDSVERTFQVPPIRMRLIDPDPEPDDTDNDYPEEFDDNYDGNVKITRDNEATVFKIEAFNPKYINNTDKDYVYDPDEVDNFATHFGKGIEKLEFRVCPTTDDKGEDLTCNVDNALDDDDDPDLSDTYDYGDETDPTTKETDEMCVYGLDVHDYDADDNVDECAPMENEKFLKLARKTYVLQARVAGVAKDTDGNPIWIEWDEALNAEFEIPAIAYGFEGIVNATVGSIDDTAKFGFWAYDPAEGQENGDGIESLTFELIDPFDVVSYTRDVVAGSEELKRDPYTCFFGGTDVCNQMGPEDYSGLYTGEYKARVWITPTDPNLERYSVETTFTVAAPPLSLAFVYNFPATYVITDVIASDSGSAFEVEAWKDSDPNNNGSGVQKVWFRIVNANNEPITDVLKLGDDYVFDSEVPYCAFGVSGTVCNQMDATAEAILTAEDSDYYVMKARALQDDADGGRWSEVIEQPFVFATATPTPTLTPTPSPTTVVTNTATATPSPTTVVTNTATATPSPSPTSSPTSSPSPTTVVTNTATATSTAALSPMWFTGDGTPRVLAMVPQSLNDAAVQPHDVWQHRRYIPTSTMMLLSRSYS